MRLAGETANRRVGRVAECTSPLTRQAVRLRRFESSTLCNFIGIWNNRILSKIASHRRFLKKHRQHRHRRGYIRNSPSIYCDPDSHLGDRSNSPRCKKGSGRRDRNLGIALCPILSTYRRYCRRTYSRREKPHRISHHRTGETLFVRPDPA